MLKEALEVFEKKISTNDRIVIDSYTLKDGTYRLIEMKDDQWEITKTLDIFYDKKRKEVIGDTDEDYYLIKQLDYYSKLIEMNKPIYNKTIHTNNYLSIAVKKESLVSNKLTREVIQGYFNILRDPITKYEKKLKSKELYQSVEEQLGPVDRQLLDKIENHVLNTNIFRDINLDKNNYVKVFFIFPDYQKTISLYKIEGERYIIPNLYNKNDYNINDNGLILGLPNNNMGMNSKKPFLENKTRKVKVPYLLDQKRALLQSHFFDYLLGQVSLGKYNFYIDTTAGEEEILSYSDKDSTSPLIMKSGYYLRCRKEKNEVEIIHADSITAYSNTLKQPFILKNYIGISDKTIEKSKMKYDVTIDELWEICQLIDDLFFDKKLKIHFYTKLDEISINDNILKRCLLENRSVLAAWFYQGERDQLELNIDKFTIDLINNSIGKNEFFKAQKQFNLRWSLLEYLNSERRIGKDMVEIRSKLRQYINSSIDEWAFENDEEFSYAVGQLVKYFLSLSKAKNKSHSYINLFSNAKSVELLKRRIRMNYSKYNYNILEFEGSRFSNLYTQIMTYEPKKINSEYITAGFTAPSLIYETKKEEE